MPTTTHYDLCIIGAGSGGLSVAAAASQLDAKVALIEKGNMGGDCLNAGCVPSKSLLAAAKVAYEQSHSAAFGIANHTPEIDFAKVHEHVHRVIAAIAPHDSIERFTKLGVDVHQGKGYFIDRKTVAVNDTRISADRFVIATGSSAVLPPIPGLVDIPYFTNETIFDLTEKPEHLIVIGGGPIGCELAQAYRRLGCQVTLLEVFQILPKDDPELSALVKLQLVKEGIQIKEGVTIANITAAATHSIQVEFANHVLPTLTGTHCLVATGRCANVTDLQLEKASIQYSDKGICVDSQLRTSNKKVYAIGDVTGGFQFTHVANYHAGLIIRHALFRLPAKASTRAIPWVTYTAPELAHVGQTEAQLKQANTPHQILRLSFNDNDRAQTDYATQGKIKVLVTPKGKVLGATIVGKQAGELINAWVLAINNKLSLRDLTDTIVPYPTLSELNKRVASSYYAPLLYSNKVKRLSALLRKLIPW